VATSQTESCAHPILPSGQTSAAFSLQHYLWAVFLFSTAWLLDHWLLFKSCSLTSPLHQLSLSPIMVQAEGNKYMTIQAQSKLETFHYSYWWGQIGNLTSVRCCVSVCSSTSYQSKIWNIIASVIHF